MGRTCTEAGSLYYIVSFMPIWSQFVSVDQIANIDHIDANITNIDNIVANITNIDTIVHILPVLPILLNNLSNIDILCVTPIHQIYTFAGLH